MYIRYFFLPFCKDLYFVIFLEMWWTWWKNSSVPYAARQALRMSFTHHPSSKEQPMLRDRNNNRGGDNYPIRFYSHSYLAVGLSGLVWCELALTYYLHTWSNLLCLALKLLLGWGEWQRWNLEHQLKWCSLFHLLKKKHKKTPNVFLNEVFFETFQLWIDSKDQLSFRYMNPYDVRKLTSRNLTYF